MDLDQLQSAVDTLICDGIDQAGYVVELKRSLMECESRLRLLEQKLEELRNDVRRLPQ